MSLSTKRALWRFFMFGMIGLALEVFVGANGAMRGGNWSLRGASSPWMLPVYGLIGIVLDPIASRLRAKHLPLVFRAVVYMIAIFAVEYISGRIYHACGFIKFGARSMETIWDYSDRPYNLHGVITLTFIPTWYTLGLFLEFLYARVDACATALAFGLRAPDLLARFSKEENKEADA